MMHVMILPPYGGGQLIRLFRRAFERFRHQHYCVRLGYEPIRSDRRETDEYDSSSTYIIVVEEGIIVGGCRLKPSFTTDDPLPLECEYKGPLNRPSYEVGRTIIHIDAPANPSRDDCQEILARRTAIAEMLYGAIHEFLANEEVEDAYAVVEPKFLHFLQRFYKSRSAFTALCEPYDVVHGVHLIKHLAMRICVATWGRCISAPERRPALPAAETHSAQHAA